MTLTRRQLLTSPALATPVSTGLFSGQAEASPTQAKRISQAELELAAERHLLWHQKRPGGQPADFGGYDLSGLRFGRWDLRHANFANANLQSIQASETRFFRAHMTGADLSGAVLIDCDLRFANLVRAKLVGAKVIDTQVDWEAPVDDENIPWYCGGGLGGANLDQADLISSRLNVAIHDTNFSRADLRNADLRGVIGSAYFAEADLRNTNLDNVLFLESSFAGALR